MDSRRHEPARTVGVPLATAGAFFALLLLALSPLARADGAPQSDPATTQVTSTVGLWHLDERSGTTAFDSSGRGHDGTISGPVTLGVPGKVNTAYSFVPKGTVIIPDAADLRPGNARITITYFLKLTTPPPSGTDYDIFTKGDTNSSGGQIKLEVQRNGQASCMFRGSLGEKQLQAGPNVIDGKWHKVICKRTGQQVVETVDGTSFSAQKATGSITNADPIRLGSHLGGGDWYSGVLDEVSYSLAS